jgi:hypothetical protein
MTVQELYEILKSAIESYPDNGKYTVGVALGIPHIGGTPTVGLKGINFGFDWDNGKCILRTDHLLVEKTKYIKKMEEQLDKLAKENYDLKRNERNSKVTRHGSLD